MSDASSPDVPQDDAFAHLLEEIRRTRAALRAQVDLRGTNEQALLGPRREALEALENFEAALVARSLPVPRQIRADVQMLRGLVGPPPLRRYRPGPNR